MRHWSYAWVVLLLFCFSCAGESSEGSGEGEPKAPVELPKLEGSLPREMPPDFYIAVREYGGSEPYDNVFFIGPDSISRNSYYYNTPSLVLGRPGPGEVREFYKEVIALQPELIQARIDNLDRSTVRGGDILEIRCNGQVLRHSNAENSYIEMASSQPFNQVNNLVKTFVMNKLQDQLKRVDVNFDYSGFEGNVEALELRINDFPLVNWSGDGSAQPPTVGYNSVLPGTYHLFGKAQYTRDMGYVTDTIIVGKDNLRLKIKVLNDKLELVK